MCAPELIFAWIELKTNTAADNLLGRGALARSGRMEAWGPPLPPEGFQPIWVFSRPPAFPLVPPVDEGVKLPICHLLQAATLSLPSPPALPPPWQPAGGDPWLWKRIPGVVCVPFSRVCVPRGAAVSWQAKIPSLRYDLQI